MVQYKKEAQDYIQDNAGKYTDISHKIWEYAELSLKEYKSAELYVKMLREEGFEVEENLDGIPTAFSGTFTNGEGGPVIGILGEFDALSGLSQVSGSTKREELELNGPGHGCGHNMLGAGSFAAACGIKHYLEQTGKAGTVIFYGCPGEEGCASKAYMARDGYWQKLDAALSWHPGTTNEVTTGTCNSCIQILYKFKGVASHAAGDPEQGRSALDAVELMNTGVQYLREHMTSEGRIHYAMIDGGGFSPNVVQPHASVLYMVRAKKVVDTLDLQRRVDLVAQGAAIMTETTYERIFVDGTANTLPNTTLEKIIHENMFEAEMPVYTEDERKYADELNATCPPLKDVPGHGAEFDEDIKDIVREKTNNMTKSLNDFVMPFYSGNEFHAGSTDVGDVSWCTPTAQCTTVTFTSASPGHSWQNVSIGATSIGDKGVIYAGKILCGAAIDLFENPELIEKAKAEFTKRTVDGGYVCPIPDNAIPYVIEL